MQQFMQVLHNWSLERKRMLIKKAFDALPPGGMFLEINSIIDNSRTTPLGGLELSITQLVEFGRENAFVYTFQARGILHHTEICELKVRHVG
jgi:hypothetical protein